MEPAAANGRWLQFGPYSLDLMDRVLSRAGRTIALNPKCFAALAYLAQRAGDLVTRDEVLAAVWPEGWVEPNNVPQTIYMLRKTLRLAADDREYIETIPGRGYRFVPAVRHGEAGSEASGDKAPLRRPSFVRKAPRAAWLAGVLGAGLVVSLILLLSGVRQANQQPAQVDSQARLAYTEGRFYWSRRSAEALKVAENDFKTAIRLDPQFARAYSGLADTYSVLHLFARTPAAKQRYRALAQKCALRSVALDANCPECHASLAFVLADIEWKMDAAESEFVESIRLDPSYATAREWYSWELFYTNRGSDALQEMRKARELDPSSPIINLALGYQLLWTRQYDEARISFDTTLSLDPRNDSAYAGRSMAEEQTGRLNQALGDADQAIANGGRQPDYLAARAHILAAMNRPNEVRASLAELLAMRPRSWYSLAVVCDALKRHNDALRYLKLALARREIFPTYVRNDPRMDALLADMYPPSPSKTRS